MNKHTPPGMGMKIYNVVVARSDTAVADLSRQVRVADPGLPNLSTYFSGSLQTTRALLDMGGLDAAICQIVPGSRRDLETLKTIHETAPEIAVVAVAASRDRTLASWVTRAGAQDCIFEDELSHAVLHRSVKYAVERKRAERALRHLENVDLTTGLLNQAALENLLNRWCYRARRSGRDRFALLVLEAREFEGYFRRFDHQFGEDALLAAARRVQGVARPSDTLALLDGNEFALLLPAVDRPHQAHTAARRIASRLAKPLRVQRRQIALTVRSSVTLFRASFQAARDMLETAILDLKPRASRPLPAPPSLSVADRVLC